MYSAPPANATTLRALLIFITPILSKMESREPGAIPLTMGDRYRFSSRCSPEAGDF
jgi:hypothetical protein